MLKNILTGILMGSALSAWAITTSITSPANGSNFSAGSSIQVSIAASDDNGTVSLVKLYEDGVLKDSLTSAPYVFTRPGLNAGSHYFQAKAWDNEGNEASSSLLRVQFPGQFEAFSRNKAARYTVNEGTTAEVMGNKITLGFINNGDYLAYDSVQFGADTARSITFLAASPGGSTIYIYRDSLTSTPLGICNIAPTGGWSSWTETSCGISAVTGVQKIFLKFVGSLNSFLLNLDDFAFSKQSKNKPPVLSFATLPDSSNVTAPTALQVNLNASDEGSISKVVLWNNGELVGIDSTSPYNFLVNISYAGKHQLLARAYDNEMVSTLAKALVTANGIPLNIKYKAFNAGGPDFVGSDGILYKSDSLNYQYARTGLAVAGTSDALLYQSEKWAGTINYQIPVPNGRHKLVLKFAEIFHAAEGLRVFHVIAEGDTLVRSLDIFKEVGAFQALDIVKLVTVNDAELSLSLVATKENAKISAFVVIEDSIFPNQPPVAPTLISPVKNASVGKIITLKWSPILGASEYEVQVGLDSLYEGGFFEKPSVTIDSVVLEDAYEGYTFFWRVRAKNENGWGNFSESNAFTVTTTVPVIQNIFQSQVAGRIQSSTRGTKFYLNQSGAVTLKMIGPNGQVHQIFDRQILESGQYSLDFETKKIKSGVWIAEIVVDNLRLVQKVLIQ